jgi:hypothetical protein
MKGGDEMKKKRFEIVLINDKKDLSAQMACTTKDECWLDMGYCESIDTCTIDYAPEPPKPST